MMIQQLKQPYPLQYNHWKTTTLVSIFIGLFMLIFQPFGLLNYQGPNKTWLCLGYGGVTFVVLLLNNIIIQFILRRNISTTWTVLKQILSLTWIIISIGLGNFIYTSVIFSFWSLKVFFYFQFFTLAIGFIPIVVITMLNHNRLLAQNLKIAREFNNSLITKAPVNEGQSIKITGDNEKEGIEIETSNLLYIESIGNYIEVFHFSAGHLKKTVLRSTLKRTELQLNDIHSVLKCHRAFLVNTDQIVQVKGNSQGLRLMLKNTEVEIPVSRNLARNLKEKLNLKH